MSFSSDKLNPKSFNALILSTASELAFVAILSQSNSSKVGAIISVNILIIFGTCAN